MKKLGMGIYLNESTGQLEVDCLEILKYANWEDTPENRDKVTAIAISAAQQAIPGMKPTVRTKEPEATRRALDDAGINAEIEMPNED